MHMHYISIYIYIQTFIKRVSLSLSKCLWNLVYIQKIGIMMENLHKHNRHSYTLDIQMRRPGDAHIERAMRFTRIRVRASSLITLKSSRVNFEGVLCIYCTVYVYMCILEIR